MLLVVLLVVVGRVTGLGESSHYNPVVGDLLFLVPVGHAFDVQ